MSTSAKKRTKKDKSIDYEADTKTDSAPGIVVNCLEVPSQKKKKKRKHHIESIESDGDKRLECSPSLENSIVDSTPSKKKKKKSKDKCEKLDESPSTLEPRSKKEKKKSKSGEAVEVQAIEESPDEVPSVKKKKKKRKRQEIEESASQDTKPEGEESEELKLNVNENTALSQPVSQPALSALTRERMEKWKKRKPTQSISFLQEDETTASVEPEKKEGNSMKTDQVKKKPLPVTSMYNPNIAVQNYNHKRVLAALGYDVKKYENKRIKIEMPPTKIPGSNLDSILGYGEGLPCL